jgi:hypothetical protein
MALKIDDRSISISNANILSGSLIIQIRLSYTYVVAPVTPYASHRVKRCDGSLEPLRIHFFSRESICF